METNKTNSPRETQMGLSPLGDLGWDFCQTWLFENRMCEAILHREMKTDLDICHVTTGFNNSGSVIWFGHYELNHAGINQNSQALQKKKINWTIPAGFAAHVWNDLSDGEMTFDMHQSIFTTLCICCITVLIGFILHFIYSCCHFNVSDLYFAKSSHI